MKKNILAIKWFSTFTLLFFSFICQAKLISAQTLYPMKSSFSELSGYINEKGKRIIKEQFEEANEFSEGFAVVRYKGKYGFINEKGKLIIKPRFSFASRFNDGLAFVISKKKFLGITIGYQYGYIDKSGKFKIKLKNFQGAKDFSEGVACVAVSGKWGYMDINGKFVIKPMFDRANSFSEGFALVEKEERVGYINRSGNFITSPANNFSFIYAQSISKFSEKLAVIKVKEKFGYINSIGNVLIPNKFEAAKAFSEGLASVKLNGKWGYIDKMGKFIIEPKYLLSTNFLKGMAVVSIDGNTVKYINKKDISKNNIQFENVESFDGLLAKVGKNEELVRPIMTINPELLKKLIPKKYAYLNKEGKVIYSWSECIFYQCRVANNNTNKSGHTILNSPNSYYDPEIVYVDLQGKKRKTVFVTFSSNPSGASVYPYPFYKWEKKYLKARKSPKEIVAELESVGKTNDAASPLKNKKHLIYWVFPDKTIKISKCTVSSKKNTCYAEK